MIEILSLQPTDFERVYQIEQLAHLTPWSKGTLLNNQGERYLNLKLLKNKQLIGFAICQTVLDEATLFNIAIDPAYQQQRLGEQLLQQLIAELRQRAVLTLWLEVRQSNVAAQKLYDRLGFNLVTQRKNYYPTADGKREDALVMALYL
ncbi:ribosomal-protein-alanine N-acetyltransferase [Testudinibacter sp. TR-2022]|uniref:ribosomal protein S18-alanine N-acetyltransferase n=1 Tax=Testudinibacter sp. TR-2022 TaxID=2585029 RepID=UPI00111A1B63|nr:ribosomal protein S18-alanine N-acetyltransferase [Testudinibacter sp. TR-2022]TNH04972.1 ribosomal-protein-alanine N-acetyltransferase [Pasteurellaceae bacterium Phil31]TNH09323.1 ribosomal-protein-alanine N-acetyltransferase [Testudinibacter sp. TR-2022]TNH09623.1 ribosomal-protein-alanine N-acetyltransferase [Testudinibacter sp. TR-2022]TNH13482.1 ribosomal-protein-alanine N-acetyltransferase [Testudinibacter sp. TR-2022]TNH19148.1 ribosomal-protein-alanine N-acetyltransferase [Testudini